MHVKGDLQPSAYSIEAAIGKPGYATVRLTENVAPYEDAHDDVTITGYEYDEYLIDVPDRDSLAADIAADTAWWLAAAKRAETERLAAEARARTALMVPERVGTLETDSVFIMEYASDNDYRICLLELGLTESDF